MLLKVLLQYEKKEKVYYVYQTFQLILHSIQEEMINNQKRGNKLLA